MKKLSTKQKGDISELRAMAELTELGLDVYTPYGEDCRSDLIVDTDDELLKLQVKTSRKIDESKIEFNCHSTRSNYTETTGHDYRGDIDAFVVFYPKTESLYYVPVDVAPKTSMYLRMQEPKNGQTDRVNMANDYKLEDKFGG